MNEDPKALAVRYHRDIFQAQQLDVADQIIDVSFRVHAPGLAAETSLGPMGVKRLAEAMITGAPDLRITHDEVIGEGDKVLAELWQGWDQFGLFRQIGAIVAPAPL